MPLSSKEIASLIAQGDPLIPPDWTLEKEIQACEQRERVRQRCVQAFSSAPLYAARAAKDPDYWSLFSVGQVR